MPVGSRNGNSDDGSGIREVSKTLSAERREKLLALRDRERMKGVLLDKFERKYGTDRVKKDDDDTQSISESVLRREVNTFVDKAALTEDNLARLERRMRQHARKKVGNDDVASIISAYSKLSENPDQYQLQPLEGISENQQYDWGRLDEYAKFLYERDEVGQKRGIVEQKQKLRTDLDKQIQDAIERKKFEKDVDKKFHDYQMADLERWKVDEEMKEREIKNKLYKEKETRDIQLKYEREMRDEEIAKKQNDEELFVRRITNEVIMEKENLLKKKEQDRENMKIVYAENELDKQQKIRTLEQQRQQDIEFALEYGRIEDRRERAKAAEMQGRLDRQNARAKNMETLVANVQRKQEADAAAKSAKERQEIDRRKMEAERNKAEKLKEMRLSTQDFLLQQMQERDANKQQRRDDKIITAGILSKDSEDFARFTQEEVEARKLRNLRHKDELERQIQSKKEIRQDAMSTQEIAMNRDLLKKVDDVLPPVSD